MMHLHQEKVVHRDLAARNVLVSICLSIYLSIYLPLPIYPFILLILPSYQLDETYDAVVSDFGLSRIVFDSNGDGKTIR